MRALLDQSRAEYVVEDIFSDNLDKTATGHDMRKLAINIDLRFDAVDRRFDAVDKKFIDLRHDMHNGFNAMNERFNKIEHRLTHHFVNSIGWMIATNIAVFGTVIASLAYLAEHLQ